ncbi:glycosyltransferase family 2 protein [Caminibacter pacificus]
MNNEKVSIIVPNYNGEKFIKDTIDSVKKQSYQNWEMIIVDDCSTDGSPNIIKNLALQDERIKPFFLEKNSGRPAVPRNFAMKKATGKYIAFLDNDDLWHSKKLEYQVSIMKKTGISFTSTRKIDFKDFEIPQNVEIKSLENISLQKITHDRLLLKNIIPNSSVVVEKKLIDDMKFNVSMDYKAVEDNHMWLRLHQKIEYSLKLMEPLLFYRIVNTSISRSKLSMAKKTWNMLKEYEVNGERLGWRRFYYFGSYIFYSLKERIKI